MLNVFQIDHTTRSYIGRQVDVGGGGVVEFPWLSNISISTACLIITDIKVTYLVGRIVFRLIRGSHIPLCEHRVCKNVFY